MKHFIVWNTKNKGTVRIFTYKQGSKFISVCLELDIVKEGNNILDLNKEMFESVVGHIKTVCKEKMDDKLLNRPAPQKYWDKYQDYLLKLEDRKKTSVKIPLGGISTFGIPELCGCN